MNICCSLYPTFPDVVHQILFKKRNSPYRNLKIISLRSKLLLLPTKPIWRQVTQTESVIAVSYLKTSQSTSEWQ